jgi:hypothetical protein
MIKNKDTDNLFGQMVDPTKDNGKMVSKMGRGPTEIKKEWRRVEHG